MRVPDVLHHQDVDCSSHACHPAASYDAMYFAADGNLGSEGYVGFGQLPLRPFPVLPAINDLVLTFIYCRTRIKFWQLVMVMTFILDPFVTAQIWSVFDCWHIGAEWLLRADMNITCYTAEWGNSAYPLLVPALLYSFAIPLG